MQALAERADREAASANGEFERVLGKHTAISKADVEEELTTLPAGVSVVEQKESAEKAYDESTRQLGPMKQKLESARGKQKTAHNEARDLGKTGPLPTLAPEGSDDEILAEGERLRKESIEQSHWSEELIEELAKIGIVLQELENRKKSLGKDLTQTQTIAELQSSLFARLKEFLPASDPAANLLPSIKTDDDVSRIASEIATSLQEGRDNFEQLDRQREEIAKNIHRVAGESRFEHVRDSISVRPTIIPQQKMLSTRSGILPAVRIGNLLHWKQGEPTKPIQRRQINQFSRAKERAMPSPQRPGGNVVESIRRLSKKQMNGRIAIKKRKLSTTNGHKTSGPTTRILSTGRMRTYRKAGNHSTDAILNGLLRM